jgi:hypothetical protein
MANEVYKETIEENVLKIKEMSHYINLMLEVEGVTYAPQFGLGVFNDEADDIIELLQRMDEKGNTTAVRVAVTKVTIGKDFIIDDTEDSELDKLLGSHTAPILEAKTNGKTYAPTLFNVYTETTTPYFKQYNDEDAVIKTTVLRIPDTAPRIFLSKLLKLVNSGGDIETEVLSVRNAHPPKTLKKAKEIDF